MKSIYFCARHLFIGKFDYLEELWFSLSIGTGWDVPLCCHFIESVGDRKLIIRYKSNNRLDHKPINSHSQDSRYDMLAPLPLPLPPPSLPSATVWARYERWIRCTWDRWDVADILPSSYSCLHLLQRYGCLSVRGIRIPLTLSTLFVHTFHFFITLSTILSHEFLPDMCECSCDTAHTLRIFSIAALMASLCAFHLGT
jgi:hypothetical protein